MPGDNPYYGRYIEDCLDESHLGINKKPFCLEFLLPTRVFTKAAKKKYLSYCAHKVYSDFPTENDAKNEYILRITYDSFVFYNHLIYKRLMEVVPYLNMFVLMPVLRKIFLRVVLEDFKLKPNFAINVLFCFFLIGTSREIYKTITPFCELFFHLILGTIFRKTKFIFFHP